MNSDPGANSVLGGYSRRQSDTRWHTSGPLILRVADSEDMDPEKDAYGRLLRAHHEGEESFEIVERDDGFVGSPADPEIYFLESDDWPARETEAIERVRGRVLDVGCGAGRHALHLQERGFDVTGIDASPGAVEVCEARGLDDARVLPVEDADALGDDSFDAALLMGNNFGLVGTRDTAPEVLETLARITTPGAALIAESRDPLATDDPAHRKYHERNLRRGRLPGALRIRVRFRRYATDWFDYLMASPAEMEYLVRDTPWRVDEIVHGDDGPSYVGVLRKA